MKIILLEDVKNVGKKDEIVEVNDSYGRNVLLRTKKGMEANGKNLNDLKLRKANDEKVAAENLEAARELADKIKDLQVVIKVKVGEGGKLFGAIASREIAEAAEAQLSLKLDKKKIQMSTPIKSIGEHKVPVRLHPKVSADLKVIVEEA